MPKSEFDPLALTRTHFGALYVLDEQRRIVRVNDIGRAPRPFFSMVRTTAGNICLVAHDLAPALAEELLAIAAEEPIVEDFEHEPVRMLEPAMKLLVRDGASHRIRRGPAFVALDDPPSQPREDTVRELPQEQAALLHDELADWRDELAPRWPAVVAFDEGRGVAICASARLTPVAAAAGLETAPSFRQNGLGVAAAAAWIRAVRASGRVAFYSTEWENAASRSVAARLRVHLIGEDVHII